jgi:hypothetical protein
MNVRWWRVLEGVRLEPCAAEAAIDAWKRKEGSLWADVHSYAPEELDGWLRELELGDPVRDCCLAAGEMSRVMPLQEAFFFELPVDQEEAGSGPASAGFLCLDRLVVTLHREPLPGFEGMAERIGTRGAGGAG